MKEISGMMFGEIEEINGGMEVDVWLCYKKLMYIYILFFSLLFFELIV